MFVAACSSASTARQPTPPPPDERSSAPSGPTDRECEELITHAVALGIDERDAQPPATTQADHEAVRRKLRDDLLAGCRALPRDIYRCAMAATTLSALAACQPSPSSSTSNSSVAPGGMTPPAPRSP
jgi:hypothetical protein